MRLQLDATGTKATAVRPLAVAQPEFDYPSFGTVKGEDLYYFASSQSLASEGPAKPVTVLRTPLDSSADLVQPDMQEFMQQQAKKVENRAKEAEKN